MKVGSSDKNPNSIPFNIDKQWSFSVPQDIENMSDFDKMLLIRTRKRLNRIKVKKFFGSDLKIDVSLNMIKKLKLPAILESDLPLAYFLCFLIKYQGVENLLFCLEVEKYDETRFETEEARKLAVIRIFNTFMEDGLPMQINTKKENIETVRDCLRNNNNTYKLDTIFQPSYTDIYSMLMGLYTEFEKHEYYLVMMSDLNISDCVSNPRDELSSSIDSTPSLNINCGSIYPVKAYYCALDRISYIVGCMGNLYHGTIPEKRVSINRHNIIRRMIALFCEQRLQLEFHNDSFTLRQSLLTNDERVTLPLDNNPRASIISSTSSLSNFSQSNASSLSVGRRKDELDMF